MESFWGESLVFFLGAMFIFILASVKNGVAKDWRLVTSDNKFDYYFNKEKKVDGAQGVFEIQVKAVCIDRKSFLGDIKTFGRSAKNYEAYSHTIFVAKVDCPNKRYLVTLITEYNDKGKAIDYVSGAMTNWLPVSSGTLGEILYQAACH